jgi:hypothetical protein
MENFGNPGKALAKCSVFHLIHRATRLIALVSNQWILLGRTFRDLTPSLPLPRLEMIHPPPNVPQVSRDSRSASLWYPASIRIS